MKNPQSPSIRILIVDDKPQVRQDLRFILGLSGAIDVIGEASDRVEAISMTKNLKPDLVLMDLEMPVMDGYEACQRIKKCCPDCPVIALTIHTDAESRRKACQAGVDHVIEKGVPLQDLLLSSSLKVL